MNGPRIFFIHHSCYFSSGPAFSMSAVFFGLSCLFVVAFFDRPRCCRPCPALPCPVPSCGVLAVSRWHSSVGSLEPLTGVTLLVSRDWLCRWKNCGQKKSRALASALLHVRTHVSGWEGFPTHGRHRLQGQHRARQACCLPPRVVIAKSDDFC